MGESGAVFFYTSMALVGVLLSTIFVRVMILQKRQLKYEEEFISKHREIINHHQNAPQTNVLVPLTFLRREDGNYVDLCKDYWLNRRISFQQRIESHYLGFRRVRRKPRRILMEMVRCSEGFALVEAESGISAYVLIKVESQMGERRDYTLFYISNKFRLNQEIEFPQHDMPTRIDHLPREDPLFSP